jgi:hypothetical protein
VTAQWSGNASPAMNEIFAGTAMKDKRVASNAPASICVSSESDSNEIDESERHFEKHYEPTSRTERGIVIAFIEEHEEKAFDSMCVNSEFDSNESDERD